MLYIAESDSSINAVLVVEKSGKDSTQSMVYYLSRALQDTELRYPPIEKLVLVVVEVIR